MTRGFVLTSPNVIGMPVAERAAAPSPVTIALVDEQWPQIVLLLAQGHPGSAIPAMETLAAQMRQATVGDAPLFRDALTLARRILYDGLAQIGRTPTGQEPARAALDRCAAWDDELRPDLEELSSSISSPTA